jgi:hypothetical protein
MDRRRAANVVGDTNAPKDRVLVVLSHGNDPHVDVVVAHESRKHRFEALAKPGLLELRLLPQRPERALRSAVLCDGGCG